MSIVTTGDEDLDQTRAFARRLQADNATRPPLTDLAAIQAARTRQFDGTTAPVPLAHGQDRIVDDVPVRVFTPADVRGVFLHIHGGGWSLGSAHGQDDRLWRLAERASVAVVSVDYRLAPENPYPAGPDDCERVALWLVDNSEREFSTDRLMIGGESAGAHLSVLTLLRMRDRGHTAFRAAQLTFGMYDLSLTPSRRSMAGGWLDRTPGPSWFAEMFVPGTTAEERRDPAVSPLYADLRCLPPARFTVGTADSLLDDTLFMHARWRAAGNQAELEVVAEAGHGFTLYPLAISEREHHRQEEFIAKA
ncbi:alpha/beta hydrolase [Fodinicola acaciae]|uniref:alpha/beta hydrolase n=1 Tax=Fodinicola acaciae TaxID=2681555 RepID=UPI0013D1F711|nr:alpha/beta hydrolase [Fodinicola acaciae]